MNTVNTQGEKKMELSIRKVIIVQCKNFKKKGKSAMRKGCECLCIVFVHVQFHELYCVFSVWNNKNKT